MSVWHPHKVTLVEFDRELCRLVGGDERVRPFVCDGSPLDCSAFIVGANPASEIPFWPFWSTASGFDKSSWQATYEQTRIAAGKRPVSSTRERINRISQAASPVSCLETNVFAEATATLAELQRRTRPTSLLALLIEWIEPRVILAHGRDAARSVGLLELNPRTTVIQEKHLRFVSYERAWDLGRRIREVALRG